MKLCQLFNKKNYIIFALSFSFLLLIYIILRIYIFESDPFIPFVNAIYKTYLYLAESLANLIFQFTGADGYIKGRTIIFAHYTEYQAINEHILKDWPKYLLFKKWSAFLLFLFWTTISPVKKKLIYTGLFFIIHYMSVVSGLVILVAIAPAIFDLESDIWFGPLGFARMAMIMLLVVWFKKNKTNIENTLGKLNINLKIQEHKVAEIIVWLYIYTILIHFIIPLSNLNFYGSFLARVTEMALLIFNYEAFSEGFYLYGENETIAILKTCFGIQTMLIFASLVYFTGSNNKQRWIFIITGVILLIIINIIRLAVLFIDVHSSGENSQFHSLYNYIVYSIIFVLWVVWFEKFSDISSSSKSKWLSKLRSAFKSIKS